MHIVLKGGPLDDGRAECADHLIAWGAQCAELEGVAKEVREYLEKKRAR